MHELQGGVYDFLGNIGGVRGVDKVQDEPMASPSDLVLRMTFRRSSAGVTQLLAVIGVFAGMHDSPASLMPDLAFVVELIANVKAGGDL